MTPSTELDELRERAILSAVAGFPFLFVYGFVWIAAGGLTYVLPEKLAPWAYMMLGGPATPIAIALERRLGYVRRSGPDPLLGLVLQLLFVQIVAFPAVLLVWSLAPPFLPVAFAAVVGAHFLPYEWLYRTSIYRVLGIVVAVGPYVLALLFREQALHLTGFFVGPVLLAGAYFVRAHARSRWQRAQGTALATSSG